MKCWNPSFGVSGVVAVSTLLAAGAASAPASQALIDFGASGTTTTTPDGSGRVWNNISSGNDLSGSPFSLLNTLGQDSSYKLTISNPPGVTNPIGFNGDNANGTTAATGAAAGRNYPVTATRDSVFGNTTTFSNNIVQAVRLTLSDLNPAETYSFDFFASRIGAGGDNRETEYHIIGDNTDTSVFLNASENHSNIVGVTGVSPNASNQIVIDIDRGPNNNNGSGFFYLNVLEINSVPEPGSVGVIAVLAVGLLSRRASRKSL